MHRPAERFMDSPSSFDQLADQELVDLYRRGREAAFTELLHRYERELFHFLIRYVSQRAAAEDVFQDTCLQIHVSIDSFDINRPFKPWLFTIARNKALDYLRRNKQKPTARLNATVDDDDEGRQFLDLIDAQLPEPDEMAQKRENRELVREVVASLPTSMREILVLAYFHALPYKDVARMLNIPLGTVKSRLHAAVGTFAQRWKEVRGEEGQGPGA
jgi:RNA polymerase sigma-70 factor, ECF subfamily